MNVVVIPPGGAAIPHFHRGFETAIYIIKGRVETRYGPGLTLPQSIRPATSFTFPPTCRTSQLISPRAYLRWRLSPATTQTNRKALFTTNQPTRTEA